MDRLNLKEQLELIRDDESAVADARQSIADDAEQARRFAKVRAFDAAVGAVVRKVAIPEGLADRVSARIRAESAASTVRRRRNLLFIGAVSAIAIALLCVVSLWRRPDPRFTSDNVAMAAEKLYHQRRTWTGSPADMPAIPSIPLRGELVIGFQETRFLNKEAVAYRLEAPGASAALIVVNRAYFPVGFDFSSTYVIEGDEQVEIRFYQAPNEDEVCILVAPNVKPFQSKALIF
jgi:hypothetical protein